MTDSKARWKRVSKITALALALLLACLAAWTLFVEPNRLVFRDANLYLPNWPAGLEGMKVAVLSDLHVGSPYVGTDKLSYIVMRVNAAQPDMVVLLGDFVIQEVVGGKFVEPEVTAGILKGLRARLGVFAVLGNHDWWYDGLRVKRALESAGIIVLEDDAARVERGGEAFWVAGLADAWTNQTDIRGTFARVTDEGAVIAITHNPDIFPKIPRRAALTLAGHTHGGQVNLPFLGRLRVPSEFGQRYAAGHVVEDGRHLFVTTGIGTSIFPVRFRVPPEIVFLTLKATQSHTER
jgi:uncharacterized protein